MVHAQEIQVREDGRQLYLMNKKKQKNIFGKVNNTTNNRMELMAAIMALKTIKDKSQVTIFTDSTYVKNGITEWIKKWEKK